MNETLKGVKGDRGKMLGKQDMMLEKHDETIVAIEVLPPYSWGFYFIHF